MPMDNQNDFRIVGSSIVYPLHEPSPFSCDQNPKQPAGPIFFSMIGSSYSTSNGSNCQIESIDTEKLKQKYTIVTELGRGLTGCVLEAYRLQDQKGVAIKCIYKVFDYFRQKSHSITHWKKDRELGKTVPMEIFILKRIRHDGIVQYLDLEEDENVLYFLM
jgi:serine/threonine protein kinase